LYEFLRSYLQENIFKNDTDWKFHQLAENLLLNSELTSLEAQRNNEEKIKKKMSIPRISLAMRLTVEIHTHTHTHTHIYIYTYIHIMFLV
jgi:hypothetical protein